MQCHILNTKSCLVLPMYKTFGVATTVRLMVSAAHNLAETDLLSKKNTVPWLISLSEQGHMYYPFRLRIVVWMVLIAQLYYPFRLRIPRALISICPYIGYMILAKVVFKFRG